VFFHFFHFFEIIFEKSNNIRYHISLFVLICKYYKKIKKNILGTTIVFSIYFLKTKKQKKTKKNMEK